MARLDSSPRRSSCSPTSSSWLPTLRYRRAEQALGAGVRASIDRIRAYDSSVRRYYVVNASFGAVVAIIDGLALWALGIPVPAVWAILAFVTNFIPNIGFVLGLVPAVLAFVVGGRRSCSA